MEKVYAVDDCYGGPRILGCKVLRETKCFYFLDKMINYSNRKEKELLGKHFFVTPNEAIRAFVCRWEQSVQHANEMVQSRTEKLNEVKKWAALNNVEVGEQPTTPAGVPETQLSKV